MMDPVLKRPDPLIAGNDEVHEATRSVHLLLNKVNELAGDGEKILRSYEAPSAPIKSKQTYKGSLDDEEGDSGILVPA